MRLHVVYKEASDHAREIRDYLRDFESRTGKQVDIIDPDTPSGAQTCRVYDIVEYPTFFAVSDDGKLQNMWRGRPLPLIDELSYYAG